MRINIYLFLASMVSLPSVAQQAVPFDEAAANGYRVQPAQTPPPKLETLKVPAGFALNVFAKNLKNARMMAVAPDGTVFLTRPDQNDVLMLRDTNKDGVADTNRTVASNLEMVHGIAIHQNKLYIADMKNVYVAGIHTSGVPETPKRILSGMPEGSQHPRRTLGISPDGLLYISIGSSCNSCVETNPEYAAMVTTSLDGSNRTRFATGLRNTLGFDWHPQTKELWGMDQGADWRGNDDPPEELNKITKDSDYGWPFCFGKQQVDRYASQNPKNESREEFCKKTEPSVMNYEAHSAALGFAFYNGTQFPAEYKGSAFVTFRGSWNRKPPSGYKVARLIFENGKPARFEDFITGFLSADGKSQSARLAGVAVGADGALLLADDANGVIYRVAYKGTN